MTTAARPTFDPAKGGTSRGEKSLSSLSKQYSSRDLPSHTKLKYRQSGQGTTDDLKTKDFRRELEEREHLAALEKDGKRPPPPSAQLEGISALPSTSSSSSASASAAKKPRIEYQSLSQLDADEKLGSDSEDDDGGGNDYDDSDDDDDDSEDDTAALLAELNRIKQERAAEEAKKDEERKLQENQIRMENILAGNPLLNPGSKGASAGPSSFKVKRRWDDDVVFKNCAKGEGQNKRGFINDTLRSDFHRKFMEKYIK